MVMMLEKFPFKASEWMSKLLKLIQYLNFFSPIYIHQSYVARSIFCSFLTWWYEVYSFLYWNMLIRTVAAALAAFTFPELEKKKGKSFIQGQHTVQMISFCEPFHMKRHRNVQTVVSAFMEINI